MKSLPQNVDPLRVRNLPQLARATLPHLWQLLVALLSFALPVYSAAEEKGVAATKKQKENSPKTSESAAKVADLIASAKEALSAGVPEVALVKIEELPPETRKKREVRLIEIEARARSAEPALATQVSMEDLEDSAPANFWRARALATLGRWPEALLKFQQAADLGFGAEALLGIADSLRAIGADDSALEILNRTIAELGGQAEDFLITEALVRRAEVHIALKNQHGAEADIERLETFPAFARSAAILRGRLALMRSDFVKAAELFQSAMALPNNNSRNAAAAAMGLAKALDALGRREEARRVIGDFINTNETHPALTELFAAFDMLQPAEPGALAPELLSWARGPNTPRKLHAVVYVAKAEARAGKTERAIKRLKDFLQDFPDAPTAIAALIELARLELEDGANESALQFTASARALGGSNETMAWISFLEGRALFGIQNFTGAAAAFEAAADHPALQEKSLFNAAICAIRTGDYTNFLERYAAYSARFPESPSRRDLLVEQGLFQARNRDPEAEKTLQLFLRDFSEHYRTGEARLALAEIQFQKGPEQAGKALSLLDAAREDGLSDELAAQADLLELYIADTLPTVSLDEVVRLGKALLAKQSENSKSHLIRLKLGSVYFRIEDFTNARNQFELAAKDAPDPETADLAMLMAGLAAMRMMDTAALETADSIFEELATGNGPHALEARRFQGEVKTLLGRHAEAVVIYDLLLAANLSPREQAEITLLKAEALRASGDGNDSVMVVKALPLYDAVASSEAAYPSLRNEALFLKGRSLEALGQPDKALAAYFDVLRSPTSGMLEPEYFWFYKAGFNAARLLEERQRFQSAVEIYAQLADADGPGAKDAARRMEQLRLRHFIWGD